ncbi:MAG: sigma-70 family RNA polymerase sigma factor [Solirubrobacterales bacterium]|nr:sigma-70 family RNA polymerase sigma factor [Solirubrobacterales bacterium]
MAVSTLQRPRPVAHRTLDDDRLVVLAQAGDRSAFDQLAERHSIRLRRVLFRITRDCDAAYDAVQETLMRAWRNIGRFEGRSQFSTWLTRIGINEAYRGLPRASEQPLELSDEVGERIPSWGARPDEIFESREFLQAVDRALGQLPLDYRTAVTLRDVEGLSTAEAAGVIGIGERALKSRVHRGRMALRAKLDDYFQEGYA